MSPFLGGLLISIITIFVNAALSWYTINTNRKLNAENVKTNAENAGKNRVIYGVEEMTVTESAESLKKLNDKLNLENYAILAVSTNRGNFSQRIYSLGKIKQ